MYPFFLTFTTLLANSANDKLVIVFLFFPENRIQHFMQIVSSGDFKHFMQTVSFRLLHEMLKPFFFPRKQNSIFHANCLYLSKLSLFETICMKCQNLFSGKNKKNISKCHLLKSLPRLLCIKLVLYNPTSFNYIKFSIISDKRGYPDNNFLISPRKHVLGTH